MILGPEVSQLGAEPRFAKVDGVWRPTETDGVPWRKVPNAAKRRMIRRWRKSLRLAGVEFLPVPSVR